MLRRSSKSALLWWVVVAALLPGGARSQATLEQFSASPTLRDGFAIARPERPGHLDLGGYLALDYAHEPLVLNTQVDDGPSARTVVVKHQSVAQALLSLGLWQRALLFVRVPLVLAMRGDEAGSLLATDRGAGLGDVGLGGRVWLLGEADHSFALGVQGTLALPVARWIDSSSQLSGNESVSGHLQALAELRGRRMRATLNTGAQLLKGQLPTVHVGHMLTFGLGAGYRLLLEPVALELVAELYGSTPFAHFGDRESSPVELLAGPKALFRSGVGFGVASGAGLSAGYGTPTYRFVGSVGYQRPERGDRDADGVLDARDGCPDDPDDRDGFQDADGCPDLDDDRDGILDRADACPREAEDRDHYQDDDGCPDVDNDGDGILDHADGCPVDPEDKDAFEDADGCPDPDNDRDRVIDTADECPLEPEDRDGFEDENGCPEADNDGDAILDGLDACPVDAETVNGHQDEDGCPDKIRVDRAQGRIFVLEPVRFAFKSATILPDSFDMLREIAAVLKSHPDISAMAIEGHTDAQGSARQNLKLSQRRANSVRAFLIAAGVAAEGLSATGFGAARPLADNASAQGRAQNRRVEFKF
jgi:outer membrane protein OmpA-like peptidoglycan-associated protein